MDQLPALDLPQFSDRLPDLIQILRQSGSELESSKANQSYIPFWEDIHQISHSLKGVTKILKCPQTLADFIFTFDDCLKDALTGTAICRKNQHAGEHLQKLALLLDSAKIDDIDFKALASWMHDFEHMHDRDKTHEDRLREVPAHLFYVNEFVSKKAREITLLNLNHCVVEDSILLDEIPLWRTQLQEALTYQEFGRGLVVNFLPFLSPEGSRHLKVWAWIAAASHSRAALKQRIKEVLPKSTITKL